MNCVNQNVFYNLRRAHPHWDALKEYLESDEGGKLRIADICKDLCIIKYEKDSSDFGLQHVKWFRSVVWDTVKNTPVCVAPPKASSDFIESDCQEYIFEEYIDGFMMNCFKYGDEIHIASRSRFGATGTFYSKKTFKELFMNALGTNTLESLFETDDTFVSLVVQHPEHRVVERITSPRFYRVHKGHMTEDGVLYYENCTDIPRVSMNSELSIQENIRKLFAEKGWEFQGVVIKNGCDRWRFRSEKYSLVKNIRGNDPFPKMRFAKLFSQNMVSKYLEYYPEDSVEFCMYFGALSGVITNLHRYYVDMHIRKLVTIESIPKEYHPHIFTLHGHYLGSLKKEGKMITREEVQLYVFKLPWQRVYFMMNKYMNQIIGERVVGE
jgi:hypothetical protein